MEVVKAHRGHAGHLVAEVDGGQGYELPPHRPVAHQLQGALWRRRLEGGLLGQHLVHLLPVLAWTPQSLQGCREGESRKRRMKGGRSSGLHGK